MKMFIEVYFSADTTFTTYFRNNVSQYDNAGGWASWEDFIKDARKRHGFICEFLDSELNRCVRFQSYRTSIYDTFQEIYFADEARKCRRWTKFKKVIKRINLLEGVDA